MPFADGAKTEDEAQAAFRCAGLVGMRHDAGIEQRRGFERVFVEKIGADQLALDLGKGAVSRQGLFHFVGARFERLQQVAMAALEILQDIGQLAGSGLGSSARTRSTIWFARVLSVGLRSRGSVAGLNGRTITRAGSGRR